MDKQCFSTLLKKQRIIGIISVFIKYITMMLISLAIIFHNAAFCMYLHKVDRIYTYDDTQIVHFKCPQTNRDMYLMIQTEAPFELIIGNITIKQDQLESKHFIQYGKCLSQIIINPTTKFTVLQGFIQINTFTLLLKGGHYQSHQFNVLTFFKFEIPSNSIIWLEIKEISKITHPFEIKIQQDNLPTFESQFQRFIDVNYAIRYIQVPKGVYYVIMACGHNQEYLFNTQEYGQSKVFVFLPQNTSSENLAMQLADQTQEIFIRVLIGQFKVCYTNHSICQIISMDDNTNQNFIAPSKFKIVSIDTEFVLFQYQSLALTIGPYIQQFTFIMNEWYQTIPSILLYTYQSLEYDSDIINFELVVKNSRQFYQIQYLTINNLIMTQINITQRVYYQPQTLPEVVILREKTTIKIQNISHKRIYGLYTEQVENGFTRLETLSNSILILFDKVVNSSLQIDLDIAYKSTLNQRKQYIHIMSRENIHFSVFPFNLQYEFLYEKSINQHHLLTFNNIRAIEIYDQRIYYYLLFFNKNKMIFLKKTQLLLPTKYNTVVDFQHVKSQAAIQYFILNAINYRTCRISHNDSQLYEGELISHGFVLLDVTDCVIFFYVDQYFRCTYLYENQPRLIDFNRHYCSLIQQNFINFISMNHTIVDLYITVQTLDASEQVPYPNSDKFDFHLAFSTNSVLDLSFYDCLQYDCLLKIKVQNSVEQFIKQRNCYPLQDLVLHSLVLDESIDLCNSTDGYSILQIYGSLQLDQETQLKCTSDECHCTIIDIAVRQVSQYPLNITNMNLIMNNIEADYYIRYGTLDNGNILIYSKASLLMTNIPYTFDKFMNISISSFIMASLLSINKQVQALICVEYGNLTIQNQLIINDQGRQYCTLFSVDLIELLYLTITTQALFTIQFTYINQVQIYINQLNEFTTQSKLSYFFYNPVTQTIVFHTNVDYNLLSLELNCIIPNDTTTILPQGYYEVIPLQQQNYVYFTMFSYPTYLYNNITFRTQLTQNWTILNQYKKKYIIIQILEHVPDYVSYYLEDKELDIINNIIILELTKSENIITSNGNFTFRAVYADDLCIMLNEPIFSKLKNHQYEVQGTISETCQLQFIEFQYNDSIQRCFGCLNFNFIVKMSSDSTFDVQLKIISQDTTFIQQYSYQPCKELDLLQDYGFIIKITLWLVIALGIYLIHSTQIQNKSKLNSDIQNVENTSSK